MHRILIVDDDAHVLSALQRQLHGRFEITAVPSGERGLDLLEREGPFAAVVSDLRMPGLDGVAFLRRASQIAPETVRLMLTGAADLQAAVDAVNEGHVYRFLSKPCQPDRLVEALQAAVRQYELIRAEADLLDGTLRNTVEVLVDCLALVYPHAFGRAPRLRRLARAMANRLGLPQAWEAEIAVQLAPIGRLPGIPSPGDSDASTAGPWLDPMEVAAA